MARNFSSLRENMDTERRVRVEERVQKALKAMPTERQSDLQIRAVFPEGDVLIDQFEDLNPTGKTKAKAGV